MQFLTADEESDVWLRGLPKTDHAADDWQTAKQALLLVVEHDGPTMFARIAIRALRIVR